MGILKYIPLSFDYLEKSAVLAELERKAGGS